MRRSLSQIASLAIMSVFFAMPIADAEAGRYKVKCKGGFQLVQGNWIATPNCEERVLVRVARSYGNRHVSLKLVRSNPVTKIGICRAYGHDIRLSGICDGYKKKGGF